MHMVIAWQRDACRRSPGTLLRPSPAGRSFTFPPRNLHHPGPAGSRPVIRLNCFVPPRPSSRDEWLVARGATSPGPSSVGVLAKPSAILVVRTPRPHHRRRKPVTLRPFSTAPSEHSAYPQTLRRNAAIMQMHNGSIVQFQPTHYWQTSPFPSRRAAPSVAIGPSAISHLHLHLYLRPHLHLDHSISGSGAERRSSLAR